MTVLILNAALQIAPDNKDVQRSLSTALRRTKRTTKAIEGGNMLLDLFFSILDSLDVGIGGSRVGLKNCP